MKKLMSISAMLAICAMLGACGNDSNGTYYPDSAEMKANLESKSYNVSVDTIEKSDSTITSLTATKDDEYIEFYWFDNDKYVDEMIDTMKVEHNDYSRLSCIKNNTELGTLAFCTTEKAMDDSGIVIVEVNVKVAG